MAIIKMVNAKSGKVYGLKAVLDYIQNPEKTLNGELVSAKDCLLEQAYAQMCLTKQIHHQTKGRQFVHIIQSFALDDRLDYQTAHEIGQRLLERFKEYQGVVATHTNEKHIHNHLILNTVNMENGRKWQMSRDDLHRLRQDSDRLCREYGLSVIESDRQGWKSYGEHTGASWKAALAAQIAESLSQSETRAEFLHQLYGKGIQADFGYSNIMFITADGKRCGNGKLMAYGDFSRENIENHWKYNNLLFQSVLDNPSMIYEALSDLSGSLDVNQDDLMARYFANQMTQLEGRALREWIVRHKDVRAHFDYELEALKQKQRQQTESKNVPLLATVGALLNELQQSREVSALIDDIYQEEPDWEL